MILNDYSAKVHKMEHTIIKGNGCLDDLIFEFDTDDYEEMICWVTNHAYEDISEYDPEDFANWEIILQHFINNLLMYYIQIGAINTLDFAILMHYARMFD